MATQLTALIHTGRKSREGRRVREVLRHFPQGLSYRLNFLKKERSDQIGLSFIALKGSVRFAKLQSAKKNAESLNLLPTIC